MNNGVSVTFDMDFVGTALTLLVFGWISGRLLGVRRGFWRAFVAGLVGLTAGYALVYVQFGDLDNLDDPGDVARLGVGFVGYVLLVTMLNNLLNFVSVSSYYQWIIQGIIIVAAVGFHTTRRR